MKRQIPIPAFSVLLVLLHPSLPLAQQSNGDTQAVAQNRYELRSEQGGFVRLDRQAGGMSLCRIAENGLDCRPAADEREALLRHLDDMEDRISALEQGVAALQKERQAGEGPSTAPRGDEGAAGPEPGSPGDGGLKPDEIDRAMDLAGRAMRRFFEVVKELRSDFDAR